MSFTPSTIMIRLGLIALFLAIAPWTDAQTIQVGPIEIIHRARFSGDLMVVGKNLHLEQGQTNHDVVVALGDVYVDSAVEGKLIVIMGKVELGPQASINRKMILVGGEFKRHPDAQFSGFDGLKITLPAPLVTGLQDWVKRGLLWGRPLPHDRLWAWWIFGVILVCFLFLGILMPGPVTACSRSLESRPLTSFLVGLLTWLSLGPLIFLLAASVVGSLAIPFLLCGFLASLAIGQAGLNACVGRRVQKHLPGLARHSPALELATGTILIGAVCFVPVLGMFAIGIMAVLGLGAAVLSFARSLKAEVGDAPPAASPPLKVPTSRNAPQSEDPDSAPTAEAEAIYLPRAGFWIRLAATLLDLVLIGTLLKLLAGHEVHKVFLVVWFAYHVLMWGWRGSTLGGLVLGLKVFKQSGEDLNFATAFVRSLAAFFSALVLFIGFFWAGWTREKLSWHDIISGTVIAKCPREVVLT